MRNEKTNKRGNKMNKHTLRKRMTENYSNIKHKITAEEKAWAEKFEEMEYSIERGKTNDALRLAEELKGQTLDSTTVDSIKEAVAVQDRCNPALAERTVRLGKKRNQNLRAPKDSMYDTTDHIEQRFDSQGYEQAVSISPEDAIIEAIDASRDANASLTMLLLYGKTWTPARGKGRPKKEVNS